MRFTEGCTAVLDSENLSGLLLAKLLANGHCRRWTPTDISGRGGGVGPTVGAWLSAMAWKRSGVRIPQSSTAKAHSEGASESKATVDQVDLVVLAA